MGVALAGLSAKLVNIRECAFFKCTWYQHFGFYLIFHRKGNFHFWQVPVPTVWKNKLWKSDRFTMVVSAMLIPAYLDLAFSGWNKKPWSKSVWFSWSLFKHSPVTFREHLKLNLSLYPILPPPKKSCPHCCPQMSRKPQTVVLLGQLTCLTVSGLSQPRETDWK